MQKLGPPVEVDHLISPALVDALDARDGRSVVVRPDGHIAAVVPAGAVDGVGRAIERACGSP